MQDYSLKDISGNVSKCEQKINKTKKCDNNSFCPAKFEKGTNTPFYISADLQSLFPKPFHTLTYISFVLS